MVLKPRYLNLSLAARDGMFSSLRFLTRLWGAHAFLLGCCGVPGAELKPMGCSLQPAPTARHGQATDMVDINMTMELFSLGQEKQISASRANPRGCVCLAFPALVIDKQPVPQPNC